MATKKILSDSISESDASSLAKQKHTIVTTYSKSVPVEEIEDDDAESEENDDITEPIAAPVVDTYNDSISQMLSDLQIEKRAHSWLMVVERLPNYDKDGRYDVQAKRVNCGTRPMSTDFVEEIRREFARPGKSNSFRVTIKRDGKIYAHWPEVLSLEPPPAEEILEYERVSNPTAPTPLPYTASPSVPNFNDVIKQMRQLAELRTVLFPDQAAAAVVTPSLTEETALLKLLTTSPDTLDRITQQITQRLFPAATSSEDSWLPVIKSVVDNGPGIVRELFVGIQSLRQSQTSMPQPTPASASPASVVTPSEPAVSPEIVLLGRVLNFCAQQTPPAAVAVFVDQFATQHPAVDPLIDLFVELSATECKQFLSQYLPQAVSVLEQPHAMQWLQNLQTALKMPTAGGVA